MKERPFGGVFVWRTEHPSRTPPAICNITPTSQYVLDIASPLIFKEKIELQMLTN